MRLRIVCLKNQRLKIKKKLVKGQEETEVKILLDYLDVVAAGLSGCEERCVFEKIEKAFTMKHGKKTS